ncbi:hypothetical protein CONLIGDRAFT_647302 [Coniochaeta ligniaria NRRL 30616]|uniref:Uncharacterized protein n=1 Tax=Coniochaeta ligniaria NRRL 30616 TaxID=1408157 RepID=A0A1J7J8Q9_9PEZI|nr:hypothetical protein CONLIGDRAFT_647302 [Coniochaeta ligniaria NRRL 30616]
MSSSSQNAGAHSTSQAYSVKPSVDATGLSRHWMVATIIDDNDLMFGGKSLSTWYEEDKRRHNPSGAVEQERRGRSRERHRAVRDEPHDQKHHHHHGHKVIDGKI